MRKTILLLTLFTVFSCTHKNEQVLDLYNGISFELKKGENPTEIRSELNKLYEEYFNNKQPQVPLFRYIMHPNYKLFIGIPFDSSIQQLISAQLAKTQLNGGKLESGGDYFYASYQKDGFYIAEYAKKLKQNSIIYVSAMTIQKEIADSLFTKVQLSKRLTIKTN